MTLEIILFVLAILIGALVSYRESKNNSLYRFFNKIFNSEELQMKPDNRKGFLNNQPFIMKLIWIVVGYIVVTGVLWFFTPVNIVYVQYFASAVVGTLIGAYLTKIFVKTSETLSTENVMKQAKETFDKGKDFVDDLTNEDEIETEVENKTEQPATEPKKSARERLKDKGIIK